MSGTLASASWDRTVRLWDTVRQTQRASWPLDNPASAAVFRPDGQRLAVAAEADAIEFDLTGRETGRFSGHANTIVSLTYSPDGVEEGIHPAAEQRARTHVRNGKPA